MSVITTLCADLMFHESIEGVTAMKLLACTSWNARREPRPCSSELSWKTDQSCAAAWAMNTNVAWSGSPSFAGTVPEVPVEEPHDDVSKRRRYKEKRRN